MFSYSQKRLQQEQQKRHVEIKMEWTLGNTSSQEKWPRLLTRLATRGRLLKQRARSISKPTVMKNIPRSRARNGAMSAST